ncbi:MAG: hypothetical protein GX660_13930 [Clostridiaceae bacterium]|nr:hypothetical protein [Clostridiaceae bacterium]
MRYTIADFTKDIEKILSICQEDLRDISMGKKKQATADQIEKTIIPEMNNLLKMIEKGEIPPKEQRWITSSAYITRGWNWDIWSKDKLNILLPELDDKYRYQLEE